MERRSSSGKRVSPRRSLGASSRIITQDGAKRSPGRRTDSASSMKKKNTPPPLTRKSTANLEAAIMAISLEENNEVEASMDPDGSTFAASYWKQQVILAKRKLVAVVDRHTRDAYTIHQKIIGKFDLPASLPQVNQLERERESTLRSIVSKPAQIPDKILLDALIETTEQRELSIGSEAMHVQLVNYINELLIRCRNFQSHSLAELTRKNLPPSEFLSIYDKERQRIETKHQELQLHLARLNGARTSLDAGDLKHMLRFRELENSRMKLAYRFQTRMDHLCFSHRGPIRRRIAQINSVTNEPSMYNSSGWSTTTSPPRFLLQESHVDAAISSFNIKLGISQQQAAITTEAFLQQLRRDFTNLFERHTLKELDSASERLPTKCTARKLGNELFPQISLRQRQMRHQLEKRADVCMILEAEMKFCRAVEGQIVLDRLENLATSHVKRAMLTIMPTESRNKSVSLPERLELVEPEITNSPPNVTESKMKVYYILRLLYIRQCRYRTFHYLNILRSIEQHVLLDLSKPEDSHERHYDHIEEAHGSVHALDDSNQPISYDAAWNDLAEMESNLLSLGSVVSSFDERHLLKPEETKKIVAVVDRTSVLCDLYECETWYLEAKFKLTRAVFERIYLKAFSSSAQIAMQQDILNLVLVRPLINLSDSYFWQAYVTQIVALDLQTRALSLAEDGLVDTAATDDLHVFLPPAEVLAVVRQATQECFISMENAFGYLTIQDLLALYRAVSEQAVVCWHTVVNEENEFITPSSRIDSTVFTNYYAADSGAGTLVEQAANNVYRRHVHETPISGDQALDAQVAALGATYVDVLVHAITFFQYQCDLSKELYKTGLLEEIHNQYMVFLQVDENQLIHRHQQSKRSLLDAIPAIDALAFVSATKTNSMVDWIEQHLTDDKLRWLDLTLHVQETERRYLDQALRYNGIFVGPILDFEATHEQRTSNYIEIFLSNPALDQNHKNFLAQVQSVLGQRTMMDKVNARIQIEMKLAGSICLHVQNDRTSIRRLINDRIEMNDSLDRMELVHDYMTMLLESLKMESLIHQLNMHLQDLRTISRHVSSTSMNPFTLGGLSDRETLDAWLYRELCPLEEQLGVAASSISIDGIVKFAKGETIETLWCGKDGDIVNLNYLPHPHELVKRFSKTSAAHGKVYTKVMTDCEFEIRRLVLLYLRYLDVVQLLENRAALHRQSNEDIFGADMRDLMSQMDHDCHTRQPSSATELGKPSAVDHLNDAMSTWLESKREHLEKLRLASIQTILDELLALHPSPYLLYEGRSVLQVSYSSKTTLFILGLSSHDCGSAKNLWRQLEYRGGTIPSKGVEFLKKYDSFHALRWYFMHELHSHAHDKHAELESVLSVNKPSVDEEGEIQRRQSTIVTIGIDFPVPSLEELDRMIENLRFYIEMHLVDHDTQNCRNLFATIMKSLQEASSPRRTAVTAGQRKLDAVEIFATNLLHHLNDSHENILELCRSFAHSMQADANFHHEGTLALNQQLQYRIITLEKTQQDQQNEMKHRAKLADEVLATSVVDKAYKIIFELEEARHAIDMAREELDVQKARIAADVRADYDAKIRELSLELIQKQGQFDEYRTAVQNDLRVQLHEVQKTSVSKFIETGVPMQIKTQLVRNMRTSAEIEKIMEENTALKQTLLKLRTMYDLKDAATQAAHEKAEALLTAQLAKANLVFHQKSQVESQLEATQTQVVVLQKDLLRAQQTPTTSSSISATQSSSVNRDRKQATVSSAVHVTTFAQRVQARQKAKAIVAAAVGESQVNESDEKSDEEEDTENEATDQRQEDANGIERTREHFTRSAHHMNREIRRLQKQLAKEVKHKTIALEQLHAARASSQLLLENENAKLQGELADTQHRYFSAIREIGELQHQLDPKPGGHTNARKNCPTPRPKSSFPTPTRNASVPSRPKSSFVRPTSCRAGKLKISHEGNQEESQETRPKSAAPFKAPKKYDVLRREEVVQGVEGSTQVLAQRMRPLYR